MYTVYLNKTLVSVRLNKLLVIGFIYSNVDYYYIVSIEVVSSKENQYDLKRVQTINIIVNIVSIIVSMQCSQHYINNIYWSSRRSLMYDNIENPEY